MNVCRVVRTLAVADVPYHEVDVGAGDTFVIDSVYLPKRVLGAGAYGQVIEAEDTRVTSKRAQRLKEHRVAIKRVQFTPSKMQILTLRTLREIHILRHLDHPNLPRLKDIMPPEKANPFDYMYLVMDSMDTNLSRIIKSEQPLDEELQQIIMWQILSGMSYFHALGLEHRDIKPSNILINKDIYVKTCDFGLSRPGVYSEDEKEGLHTEYVVTRYYRAPEVIHSQGRYDRSVDVWSVGCVLAELLSRKVLFKGIDSASQLSAIVKVLGTPSKEHLSTMDEAARQFIERKLTGLPRKDWKEVLGSHVEANSQVLDLLTKLLEFDPAKRIRMEDALHHPWFNSMKDSKHFQILTKRYGLKVDEEAPPERVKFEWDKPDLTVTDLIDRLLVESARLRPELVDSQYLEQAQRLRVDALVRDCNGDRSDSQNGGSAFGDSPDPLPTFQPVPPTSSVQGDGRDSVCRSCDPQQCIVS
eukprot:g47043.t1